MALEKPQPQPDLPDIEQQPGLLKRPKDHESVVGENRDARADLQADMFFERLDASDRKKAAETLGLDKLTSENLRRASSMDLLHAEGKKNGTMMLLFSERSVTNPQGMKTLNAFNYRDFEGGKFDKSLQVGNRILVNFRGNMDAYWNIGAGDMMPETVRKVKITDDKGNERVSTMRQGLRGGFYDSAGYIPVFDNYVIEVVEVWTDSELADYKKNQAAREHEELAHLQDIYSKNPGASRGKMQNLEKVFERPDLARLDATMDKAMADFGLDASFKPVLYSFIKYESGFRMNASPGTSSAWGLFQLLGSNWKWTYAELGKTDKFRNVSYDEFRNSLEGQVYSGILYFKKLDLKPVEQALGRRVDLNNPRDNYLLYIAHHEGAGGLRYYLSTGRFKSGVDMIGGYAWKVANGAEYYKQQLAGMAAAKNGGGEAVATQGGTTVIAPQESARDRDRETHEIAKTSTNETLFVGDSFTVGFSSMKNLRGAAVDARVGKRVSEMDRNFSSTLASRPAGIKKIVIAGGVNDIWGGANAKDIIGHLANMYGLAKQAGLTVVACTIHPWGEYMKKGKNPLRLQSETEKANSWIRSQKGGLVDKVVDLYAALGSQTDLTRQKPELTAGDNLHMTARGNQFVSAYIKREANIV